MTSVRSRGWRVLAVVLSAASGAAAQEARPSPRGDREIAEALGAQIKALHAAGEFSGAVLLARGDKVLVREAVGLASRESGTPNTPATRFNIGSINKAFTRLAVEQLAAEGRLALSDTLDKYVPELPAEAARRITLAHLIEHRGGTGDVFGPRFDAARGGLRELRDWLPLFADRPLEFEPGTDQRYSNAGYILLGLVVEKVTGRPYHDDVRERIFKPLGMADTGADPQDADDPRRATGYTGAGGTLAPNRDRLPWRGSSAGGGYSTVDDLRRFAEALRAGTLGGRKVGGMVIGGGGPGISAALAIEGEYTLVALANLDPPSAQRVVSRFRQMLGLGEDGPPRRRRGPGGGSAPRENPGG